MAFWVFLVLIIIAALVIFICKCACYKSKEKEVVRNIKSLSNAQTVAMSEEAIAARAFVANIVLVGDSGTGKSALLQSFQDSYPKGNLSELQSTKVMSESRTKDRLDGSKKTVLSDGVV